jgi:hypothetical protein
VIVALCTAIPDGRIHLRPMSSSHEVCAGTKMNTHHLRYNRHALTDPGLSTNMFVVGPVSYLVESFSHIPALSVLYSMLVMNRKYIGAFRTVGDLMSNVLPEPFSLLCSTWQAKDVSHSDSKQPTCRMNYIRTAEV